MVLRPIGVAFGIGPGIRRGNPRNREAQPSRLPSVHPVYIGALLDRLQAAILERQGGSADTSHLDLLEHVIRLLPLEAKLDPTKGLRLVERILEKFAETLVEDPSHNGSRQQASLLLRTMMDVFPTRAFGAQGLPIPEAAEESPVEVEGFTFEDLAAIEDLAALPPEPLLADLAAPEPDSTTGIEDPAAVTLHVLLEAEAGSRRDLLRTRLVDRLKRHKQEAPCLGTHLRDALAVAPASRDLPRIALLGSILEEADLQRAAATVSGWLTEDVAVQLFPHLLAAYAAGGGKVGSVCRRVGHAGIFAAAAHMIVPGGLLSPGPILDRILAERSRDTLPFLEILVSMRDPARRAPVVRALRAVDLPSVAASALRVCPEDRLSDRLLSGLCEDGFAGLDSHRFDSDAVASISTVVSGERALDDVAQRVYAVSALGSFPPALVVPLVASLLDRKMLVHAQPKEVRRVAQEVIDRFQKVRRETYA